VWGEEKSEKGKGPDIGLRFKKKKFFARQHGGREKVECVVFGRRSGKNLHKKTRKGGERIIKGAGEKEKREHVGETERVVGGR